MAKGIIKISYIIAVQWFIDGKKAEDVKSLLLLPENYEVSHMHTENDYFLSIIVSSPDIPEVPDGEAYPTVEPLYAQHLGKDGKYTPSLHKITIRTKEDKDAF
jgi:hypothetical protein